MIQEVPLHDRPPIGSPRREENSAALDQWRGLALVMVLISHGFYFTGQVHGIGRIGVNLFFFISGLLVFRSLNNAGAKGAWSRSLGFWKKRFIRLFPAMLAYVVALIPVVWFFESQLDLPPPSDLDSYLREIPYALIFAVNYSPLCPISLGHLWSVAVEMQFYLLAPLIFFLGGQSAAQRLVVWTILLLLLMAGGVAPLFHHYEEEYSFKSASWPMMLGFLLEYQKAQATALPASWLRYGIGAGIFLLLIAITLMLFGARMKGIVIALGTAVFLPCFLCYVTGLAIPGPPGRALRWLGERTYSIYLWQQPLTICNYLPNLLQPIGSLFSTAIGAVWYRFFERPFLSAKRRH